MYVKLNDKQIKTIVEGYFSDFDAEVIDKILVKELRHYDTEELIKLFPKLYSLFKKSEKFQESTKD